MTAKELIEILKKANPEAKVVFSNFGFLPYEIGNAHVDEYEGKKRMAVFLTV